MVTHIQKSRSSSASVLQYNEDKVSARQAAPVLLRNMPFACDDPALSPIASIYGVFEDLESNPYRNARVRTPSFHMSVNPDEGDHMTEGDVLEYIQEVMGELGYGEQPYVVYRHNDIEREHWHVVSTKLRPDGSCVDSSYEGRVLQRIQGELSQKYGYTVGRRDVSNDVEHDEVLDINGYGCPVFDPKARNKRKLMERIVDVASTFVYRSMHEFRIILESLGLRLRSWKRGEDTHYTVSALTVGPATTRGTRKGSAASYRIPPATYQSIERRIREMDAAAVAASEEARKMTAASDYIREHSSSLDEYIAKMESINLHVDAERTPLEGITRLTVLSRRLRTVLDSASGTLDLSPMTRAEATGRWMAPHKGRRTSAERTAATTSLSKRELTELKQRIRDIGGQQKGRPRTTQPAPERKQAPQVKIK